MSPGNLFWSQSQPGLLDWQRVRFGDGIGGVAYFLATALEPEVRVFMKQACFQLMPKGLRTMGLLTSIPNPCCRDVALIYAFEAMLVTLAIGGMIKLETNYGLIRRTAAAVMDLDALTALPI